MSWVVGKGREESKCGALVSPNHVKIRLPTHPGLLVLICALVVAFHRPRPSGRAFLSGSWESGLSIVHEPQARNLAGILVQIGQQTRAKTAYLCHSGMPRVGMVGIETLLGHTYDEF